MNADRSKGCKGAYIPYNKSLTRRSRENRKNPTPAEKKLWCEVLQGKRFEHLKFVRQKPLDEYIVDFYCAALKVAIEVDGAAMRSGRAMIVSESPGSTLWVLRSFATATSMFLKIYRVFLMI